MTMHSWLSEMYGTNGAEAEAQTKTAQLEQFAKLAADNNIDLSTLSPEQRTDLYNHTFKVASEDGDEDDEGGDSDPEEKDTEEEAKAEHEDKKEAQAKFAEADMMGRIMAHALHNELSAIEKDAGVKDLYGAARKAVEGAAGAVKGKGQAAGSAIADKARAAGSAIADKARATGGAVSGAGRAAGDAVSGAGARVKEVATGSKLRSLEGAVKSVKSRGRKEVLQGALNAERRKVVGLRAAGGAAALGGAAGVGAVAGRKTASALDMLGVEAAVKIAAAAGYDVDECVALLTQADEADAFAGGGEKVAFVEDFNDALHVRGLEMLETVGYPVDWSEVFGG